MRRHVGIYYIVSILFLLLLPACVQEELQQIPNEGEGFLRLGVTSVASGLSSPQTKATVSLPSEITIEIIGEEGKKTETIAVDGSSMNKDIALKTGNYTVRAYAGTHNLVQNDPYFESESKSVTIRSLQSTNVELEATVKNAWIVPNVDEDLKKHYTNWAVNLVVDGNSFPLTSKEAESTNGLFVQAGKSVDLTFDGVNVLGETKKTPLTTIQTEAAKKYLITCNPDVPQFSMELTANATHTKDGSGNLNGTDVTFVVNSFTGSNSLVQSWKVEVSYNGAVIRKYESSSVPVVGNSYTMNVVDGWPYVPQGSTLSASLTLKTGEVITPTISFNLPKPTFGVTVSAETSYSRYLNYKNDVSGYTLALANTSGTGDKVMDLWTQVKISDVILNNSKYTSLIGNMAFTYDGLSLVASELKPTSAKIVPTTLQNNEGLLEGDDIINQAWGSHTVAASFTFDGVNQSPSIPCHVTGLPYSFDFYNNETALKNSAWTRHEVRYTNDKCTIQYDDSDGYLISPKFHIPSSISTSYSIQAQYYRAWLTSVSSRTIDLRVGVTSSNTSVASNYNTHNTPGNNNTGKSYGTYTGELSLSSAASYISFSHNSANVSAQVDYLCLYEFVLQYK